MCSPLIPKMNSQDDLTELKTPPFSREAEQSVIGGLMLKNDAWDDVSEIIQEPDFYLRQHQILWKAFIRLNKEQSPFDPVTLAEFLQNHNYLDKIGGGEYLAMLATNIPSARNIIAYANIVTFHLTPINEYRPNYCIRRN